MLSSLNKVETSLSTAIQGSSTANTNIANQNKPGYNAQVSHTVESQYLGNDITGNGVHLSDTIRKANEFIYQNLLGEGTNLSYLNEMSTILGGIETTFKETENDGFSKSLETFFNSLEDLKATPDNPAFQEQLKENAQNLVDDMLSLYKSLEEQEAVLKKEAQADVRSIDTIVQNIAEINDMLGRNSGDHLELLDRRDLLEKELSQLVDIKTDKTGGNYELMIGDTIAVLNDHAAKFSYEEIHTPQIDRFNTANITLNPSATNPNDKFELVLNDSIKIEVAYGETVNGTVVDETNIYEALVFKINNNEETKKLISANINDRGDIEIVATKGGTEGDFAISLQQFTDKNANDLYEVQQIYKDEGRSRDSTSESFLQAYDTKVELSNGSLSARFENLNTASSNNAFKTAKDGLDTFAITLVDITNRFIPQSNGGFIYGEKAATNSGEEYNNAIKIGLFSGTSVKNLTFNADVVRGLDQKDYDYLATLGSKSDIVFGEKGQVGLDSTSVDELTKNDETTDSFSGFFRAFSVNISDLKADNDWALDTQDIIFNSLGKSYDQLIKVNPDEEQLNLLKYKTAYESSAKITTIIQDMISTMLNMVAR